MTSEMQGDTAKINLILQNQNSTQANSLKVLEEQMKQVGKYLEKKDTMKMQNTSQINCDKVLLNKTDGQKCQQNIQIKIKGVFKNSTALNKVIADMRRLQIEADSIEFGLSLATMDLYKPYLIDTAVFKSLKSAKKTAKPLKQDVKGVQEAYYVVSQQATQQNIRNIQDTNLLNNDVKFTLTLVVKYHITNAGLIIQFDQKKLEKQLKRDQIRQEKKLPTKFT